MTTAAAPRKTKIEDEKIDVEAVSSEDEEAGHVHGPECGHHGHQPRQIGRKERAARKEIGKAANLKPLPHIKRVTFKRHNGPVFAVSNAEVFYDSISGSYVVYGQPMVETNGLHAQAAAAQRMQAEQQAASAGHGDASKVKIAESDDEGDQAEGRTGARSSGGPAAAADREEDATGLDEKDIAIVMDQASVSRSRAIAALRANNNDIVNTIMELTM